VKRSRLLSGAAAAVACAWKKKHLLQPPLVVAYANIAKNDELTTSFSPLCCYMFYYVFSYSDCEICRKSGNAESESNSLITSTAAAAYTLLAHTGP